MTFAKRVQEVEPFLAVEVAERAQELERSGIDVVHLEFGEPDFEAPPVVRDALERAIKDGRTRYAHSLGILPLREAIAEHYAGTYGVTVSPDQILVTAGTSPAMLLLFGHLLDAGDEVVLIGAQPGVQEYHWHVAADRSDRIHGKSTVLRSIRKRRAAIEPHGHKLPG